MLTTGIVGLAALVGTPAPILSCPVCDELLDVQRSIDGPIPPDGVIGLFPIFATPPDELPLATFAAATTITVETGPVDARVAVAGEVVAFPAVGAIAWRPAAPLDPTTTYDLHLVVDDPLSICGGGAWDFAVTTTADPRTAFDLPQVTVLGDDLVEPDIDLASIVCCDGAYPEEDPLACEPVVTWSAGFCAPRVADPRIAFTIAVDPAAPALAEGQTAYRFGELPLGPAAHLELVGDKRLCGVFAEVDLVTGVERSAAEQCVGPTLPPGRTSLDPAADLSAMCVDAPYTCTVVGSAWDPEACTPWNGEEYQDGCFCGVSGDRPLAGVALLLLVLARRRRPRAPVDASWHAPPPVRAARPDPAADA